MVEHHSPAFTVPDKTRSHDVVKAFVGEGKALSKSILSRHIIVAFFHTNVVQQRPSCIVLRWQSLTAFCFLLSDGSLVMSQRLVRLCVA